MTPLQTDSALPGSLRQVPGAFIRVAISCPTSGHGLRQLLQRFGRFELPGTIFLSPDGKVPRMRVIGYQGAARLVESLFAVEAGKTQPFLTARQHQEF